MRAAVLAATVLLVACATAPPPPPLPTPVAATNHAADEAAFRKELEDAYADIVAHEAKPVAMPEPEVVEKAVAMPIPDEPAVHGAVSLFSKELRGDIQLYLTRSARYKNLIEKSLGDLELPKGLAYLPVIESGYSQTMTSRSGAHGMWQFMPDTAREYGLRVDWWLDERADPERSTRAAAQYLKDLYREFGDWSLVLAAYNCGPGRVRRALDSTGSTTFWQLLDAEAVPKETRGYVPTFFATLIIASDPATYGFRATEATDLDVKRVEVVGRLSTRALAEAAGVGEGVIKEMNPALKQGVVPPGRVTVRVPAKAAEAVTARATTLRNDDTHLTVCSYKLRDGDSLKRLARAVGTPVDTLLAMNHLRSPKSVSEGDSIYLPVRARELGALLSRASSEIYVAVHKGDTLYSIAKKHHLTVAELLDLNQLERGVKLRVGQRLRVTVPRNVTAGM